MGDSDVDTVILVCDNEVESQDILNRLVAEGIYVVGPATTASQALTLAAQTFANIAVLAHRPNSGPLGPELAQRLMNTWGVRSLILEEGAEPGDWSAMPAQAAKLRRILEDRIAV